MIQMKPAGFLPETLDLLKQVELSVARLYAAFAAAFPEDAPLWKGLVAEEEGHARRVDELAAMIARNRIQFTPDKFNSPGLRTYLAGLNDSLEKLKTGGITRRQALSIGRDFENTLSESAFYRVVRSALPQFKKICDQIEGETANHRHRLEDYIFSRFGGS